MFLSFAIKTFENTSIWMYSHLQFGIVVFSISLYSNYRLPVWTNWYFVSYWIFIMSFMGSLLLFANNYSTAQVPSDGEYDSFLAWFFHIQPGIPFLFRSFQFVLSIVHFCCSIAWEQAVDWYTTRLNLRSKMNRRYNIPTMNTGFFA